MVVNQITTVQSAPADQEMQRNADIPTAVPTAGDEQTAMNRLRDLKQLLDEGVLTQEEFDAKKGEILQKL